ncbi:MAG: GNAT family N-acetyltransferase [Marinilabiliaceae bacterium]
MTTSIDELKGMHMMTEDDKPRFADCSGEAYVGYPLFDWMFRGRSDSERSHAIWNANYAAFTPSVIVYSDSAEVRGTAIFVRPGREPLSDLRFLLHSPRLLWPHMGRIVRYSLVCESVARHFRDERTWYLYDLAVKPQHQGKGVASRLLRPMLAYFDRIGANCFLETHDAKNVAMYEHFGFALVESPTLPHSGLRHYAMLRKPKQ